MKKIFILITAVFFSLHIYAQNFYSDVRITSITLVSNDKITEGTIVIPPNPNLPTFNSGTKAQLDKLINAGTEKPLPMDYKGTISVRNDDSLDQSSQIETILILVLPPLVISGTLTKNAIVHRGSSTSYLDGYIEYHLGNLKKGQTITVDFAFKRAAIGYPKVSAFVFCNTSDPTPGNNYKELSYQN